MAERTLAIFGQGDVSTPRFIRDFARRLDDMKERLSRLELRASKKRRARS